MALLIVGLIMGWLFHHYITFVIDNDWGYRTHATIPGTVIGCIFANGCELPSLFLLTLGEEIGVFIKWTICYFAYFILWIFGE